MREEIKMIVYSDGAFTEQSAPHWYREAEELGAGGLDWHKALSRVLGTDYDQYGEPLGDAGVEISVWRSADFGAYVETGDCLRTWDSIWVPSLTDWWPFQAQYLLPLIASASNLAIVDRLNRIGNVLIAYARHGERNPIDEYTGQSLIDIRRDQERRSRLRASRSSDRSSAAGAGGRPKEAERPSGSAHHDGERR
jgi:hypothetical protein